MAGLPGLVYATLGVIMPLYGRAMRRRLAAAEAELLTADPARSS